MIKEGEGMSSGGGGGGTKLCIASQKRKHVTDKIWCAELVNGSKACA